MGRPNSNIRGGKKGEPERKCTELTKTITVCKDGYTSQRTSVETILVNEISDDFGLIIVTIIGRIIVQETHNHLSL